MFVWLSGRCWSDGQEDHRRHIWRLGGPRGRGVLWEGLHQGGPLSRLRCPLGGKVSGEGQTVQEGPGAGRTTFKCPFTFFILLIYSMSILYGYRDMRLDMVSESGYRFIMM